MYPVSIMVFSVIGITFKILSLIQESSKNYKSDYERDPGGKMKVSQAFFNGWEFKTNNHVDYVSLKSAILTRIFTEISEEKLLKIIRARS